MTNRPPRRWDAKEIEKLKALYNRGFHKGDGQLERLAVLLDRDKANVCRKARALGLTNQKRGPTPDLAAEHGGRLQKHRVERGHPKGMSGKKHSAQTKEVLSAKSKKNQAMVSADERSDRTLRMMKTRLARYGNPTRPRGNWKQSWREVGGKNCFFRSRWEANYGRYLQWLKEQGVVSEWEHEPETFWFEKIKRGVRSYTPDFRVTYPDGSVEYHEVKGWMDARSKTKLKRMKKYYPKITMVLVDSAWFKANNKILSFLDGWE